MHGPGLYVVVVVAALVISSVASPAGVSGAVLLLRFQVSVLGTPTPAVNPTNLLCNVVATPGALYRYWRQGQTGGGLTAVLLAGTVPGVVAGSVIRAELLPGAKGIRDRHRCSPHTFRFMAGAACAPKRESPTWLHLPRSTMIGLSFVVGMVGGIYGIGGGSILAPILVGAGRSPKEVAPATLASTFLTSIVGVATFVVLSTRHDGAIAPDWGVGVALGIGGLLGGYLGARLQPRLPDQLIRRVLGGLVAAIGVRYADLAAKDAG